MTQEEAKALAERIKREAPEMTVSVEQRWVVRVENPEGFWRDMRVEREWEDVHHLPVVLTANRPDEEEI